jgi:Mg-chelatase subunit ChlI
MRKIYPFPAIVGQDLMKRALLLNAVNPRIGGVLIRGERGTAKSTAARALAALLPDVEVVEECRFGCDPNVSFEWCTECQEDSLVSGDLLSVFKPTPFVDLPVSATEDRVVGTLDIEKAIKQGERHFDPGVLASANRGLLYIDEVNLLDDHVVDLLLDSAAMGINVVEREGISFNHPARFILVGTMNPEEGDLRPQLLDRFALAVDIKGLEDAADRVSIMERMLQFESKPIAFQETWQSNVASIASDIDSARKIVDKVSYSRINLENIASLTTSLGVEGHRADLVILRASRANAALEGRREINDNDVLIAAQLALPHRVKSGPFDSVGLGIGELEQRLQEAGSGDHRSDSEHADTEVSQNEAEIKKKRRVI